MSDKKINIQIDISGVEKLVGHVITEIDSLEKAMSNHNNILRSLQQEIQSSIKEVVDAINAIVFDSIVQAICEFKNAFEDKSKKETIEKIGEKAYDSVFAVFLESFKLNGKAKEPTPAPLALPGPVASEDSGKSGEDNSAVSGLVSGAFAGGGDFSSMLPDGEMLQSLGELTAKLKESAAAWLTQTGAKIADKAVDLQIMALYALDYVKAFGAMIAQIAASTAAWIANTAVKVANTAAQWAQIAATTAWNALCAVATTVTTAFGAAMAFLTSPIGLVVVAVAALIAIVVLLVKNWDTVKAAALSVWEAIKSAFGSAWKWFKETVLDPLVNGFKGMINGIIGFLNGLIAGIVKGINGVIGLLNKLNFDVPDWVPLIGGQTFGFNIAPLTAPKIPLLAQGAVLPANKPFLAVVGDQKHGTNIEAPLATIQQALADVLAQQGNNIHIRFTGDLAQSSSMLHGAEHICPMKDAALSARGSSK